MKSERAYPIGKNCDCVRERIGREGFSFPSNHFVLSSELAGEDLNVVEDSEGNPTRLRSSVVAYVMGFNELAGPYLMIPNDSEKDTPKVKSERQRLRDLLDSI